MLANFQRLNLNWISSLSFNIAHPTKQYFGIKLRNTSMRLWQNSLTWLVVSSRNVEECIYRIPNVQHLLKVLNVLIFCRYNIFLSISFYFIDGPPSNGYIFQKSAFLDCLQTYDSRSVVSSPENTEHHQIKSVNGGMNNNVGNNATDEEHKGKLT